MSEAKPEQQQPDNRAIVDAISTLARAVARQELLLGNWLLALELDSGRLPLRCVLAIGTECCEGLGDAVSAAVKAGTIPPCIVAQHGSLKPGGRGRQ